jgi:hypothetical protein
MHHGLAIPVHHDAPFCDSVEGMCQGSLNNNVDPGGSGQDGAAAASCSKTIRGTPP